MVCIILMRAIIRIFICLMNYDKLDMVPHIDHPAGFDPLRDEGKAMLKCSRKMVLKLTTKSIPASFMAF